MKNWTIRLAIAAATLLLSSTAALAGEKKLMHCFAFTVIDEATAADWDAFKSATDALPGKIPGLTKIWHGKLSRPLTVYNAKGDKLTRQHAVCMEMDGPDTLKAYSANPAHADWLKAYEKVRKPGTTTYDINGE